jgi:hypothetical protein
VVPAAYVINLPLAATPTFSVAGGVYTAGQTVALSDTTTGAKIYYTTNFTTPTTSSTLYTTPIAVSASETINAIAVAYNYSNSTMASAAYIVNLPPPSFTASVTPSALTMSATGTGSVAVAITPAGGFSSAVTFSCSGLPINATCTFNPAVVTPTGGVANTTLTITTNALIASTQRKSNPYFPEGATFAIALCFFGWKRRRAFQLGILLAVSVVGLTLFSGCGGSSTLTQSSTSTITVTGTAGAQQASTSFTLTLQ